MYITCTKCGNQVEVPEELKEAIEDGEVVITDFVCWDCLSETEREEVTFNNLFSGNNIGVA